MARKTKLKSLRGKTLKRTSYVTIRGDIVLPITTRSISEASKIKYENPIELPTKLRPANMEEIETVLKNHPRYNKKSIPMVQEFDVSNKIFIEAKEKEDTFSKIIEVIKFVDMDAPIEYKDENKKICEYTLWEDLEIEKGNWLALAEYFVDSENGLGMTDKDMENLFIAIKALQGESLFEKLNKLEKMSDKSVFELLDLIDKVEEEEKEGE